MQCDPRERGWPQKILAPPIGVSRQLWFYEDMPTFSEIKATVRNAALWFMFEAITDCLYSP
jgi:hypothetical protein